MKLRPTFHARMACFVFALMLVLLLMLTSPSTRVGARSAQKELQERNSQKVDKESSESLRGTEKSRDQKTATRGAESGGVVSDLIHGRIPSTIVDSLSVSTEESSTQDQDQDQEREENKRGEDPAARTRFRLLSLKDENGYIPPDGLIRAKEHMAVMRAAQADRERTRSKRGIKANAGGINPSKWATFGPSNGGGRIRSIVIDPGNPNNMFVGSVGGGIWHSTDAGAHWSPVDDFMANLAVSTMIMDPTNSNVMYAGTGELFAAGNPEGEDIAGNGMRGAGVFKSTDGGVTWNQLASTNAALPAVCAFAGTSCPWTYVNRLAISRDGTTILAATTNSIQRSTDGGATWSQPLTLRMLDIKFNPSSSNFAVAGGNGDAHYSSDGGRCWDSQTWNGTACIGPAQPAIFSPAIVSGRVELAFAPSVSTPGQLAIVYASVDNNNGQIYRSINGGRTFIRVNDGSNYFIAPPGGDQGFYDSTIWVNPQDANKIVVGGIGLWSSTDAATANPITLTAIGGSGFHPDQHVIVAHPGFNNTTNRVVYFGNDGGLFRADDVANPNPPWVNLNNSLVITQFYSVAMDPIYPNGGLIIGGTQDNGTWKYDPIHGGFPNPTWTMINTADGGFTAVDQTDRNYLYGETQNMGIDRFINTPGVGTTFTQITNGLTDAGVACNYYPPFILDPNDQGTMLAGGISLWRSRDVKSATVPSWAPIKPPTPGGGSPPQAISAIVVDPSTSNLIVVGHNDGSIFITFDGTSASPTWTKISNATTPRRFVTRLVIDPSRSPHWIYATFGGFPTPGSATPSNIYRSTDLGSTWTAVGGAGASALPSVPVRTLAILPADGDYLYVGTEVGILVSEDAGATWSTTQDGPANVSVEELIWQNGLGLVAATFGRGIYKTIGVVSPSCGGNGHTGPVDCTPPPPPPTGNYWDERGNWGNCRPPTQFDDASVCGIVSRGSDVCHDLAVVRKGTLVINGSVTVFGNLTNNGKIEVNGHLTVLGNISNTNLGTMKVQGVLEVGGDLTNDGGMTGTGQISVRGVNPHHFSGAGSFVSLVVISNLSVVADSDLNFPAGLFQIAQYASFDLNDHNLNLGGSPFINNGIVDLGSGNLNFTGNSFQSNDGGSFGPPYGILGTGTVNIQPASGSANVGLSSVQNNTFQPSLHFISGSIQAGPFAEGIGGSFTVDAGVTLNLQQLNLTVNGNLTNNGVMIGDPSTGDLISFNGPVLTNNGSLTVAFLEMNSNMVSMAQDIQGTGTWSGTSFDILRGSSTLILNDIRLDFTQFSSGSNFNPGGHTFTFTGNTMTLGGTVSGLGTIRVQPSSGSFFLAPGGGVVIESTFEFVSGAARIGSNFGGAQFNGSLLIDPGATLNNSIFGAAGDLTVGGTVTNSNIGFRGHTFTNNGAVDSTSISFFGVVPVFQNLSGSGSWTGTSTGRLSFDESSTTTLLNDVTYGGAQLTGFGVLNTGPFTLTAPCTVAFNFFAPGRVFGNVHRTNLGACSGPIAFGNAFNTISFTSGTPPSEVTVHLTPGPPPGFPNAVARTYTIDAVGGSGWTATLRLHYEDSELNGNNEATLQLYRFDGTSWNPQGATARNTTDNWVEYAGVTQFSPWTLSSTAPPNPTPTPTPTPTPSSSPVISADGVVLINESCPPNNSMIDPGESATVSLKLMNTGSASTTNLVATLQSNANVLIPSGPQSYGVIDIGKTVARNFTFTGNGNCGDTISLALQLQDGATDLGTAIFNLTLGCNTACAGAPRISTSTVLSCNGTQTVATISIGNSGTVNATNVLLTTVKLGGVNGSTLPQTIGSLTPGQLTTRTVTFTGSSAGTTTLQVAVTYTSGASNSTRKVSAPSCAQASLLAAPFLRSLLDSLHGRSAD